MKKILTSIILAVTLIISSVPAFAATEKTVNSGVFCINHKWGNWITTKKASKNNDGVKYRKCKKCGKKETNKIHLYTRKGNVISCHCGDVLFNTNQLLKTKLYKKKCYKLTDAQIVALTRSFVNQMVDYNQSEVFQRNELEAEISCYLNEYEKYHKNNLSANALYKCALSDLGKSGRSITKKQFMIVKYMLTKGYRVFPNKVYYGYTASDVHHYKTVKVNGVTYKLFNAQGYGFNNYCGHAYFARLGDTYYCYELPKNVENYMLRNHLAW